MTPSDQGALVAKIILPILLIWLGYWIGRKIYNRTKREKEEEIKKRGKEEKAPGIFSKELWENHNSKE